MRALIAGFEPFGGERVNPALEAVHRVRRQLGALEVTSIAVPTSFARSLPALEAALAEHRPEIVLAIGQAGGRAVLSLERVAINVRDARIPDNDGAQPIDEPVIPGGPAGYFTALPIKAAVAALRMAGLPAEVSNTAGTFVCNHVFYGLMAEASRAGFRAGLLHVPYLPQQSASRSGQPSMALEHIVQGIEIVLAVAAERTTDLALAEGAIS